MRGRSSGALVAVALVAIATLGAVAAPARAATDPLFVYRPIPKASDSFPTPPPFGQLEGPCGLAVDGSGNFYVSDYFHHVVDVYSPATVYLTQITQVDPLDGPCGLAVDAVGQVYVNDFHRNVLRYGAMPSFGTPTVIAGVGADETHPTGVAVNSGTGDVYVDERTKVAVFDSGGGEIGEVGAASLEDGYGIAVSGFPATDGFVYVPDHAGDVIKVYDPGIDLDQPVATIDGSDTPVGRFVSLRDAAVAVDDATGEIYVVDNLTPDYAEIQKGVVYVFDAGGAYQGRLKFLVEDALPPGLAVDNSGAATQGRVYVTSGPTELAAVYAYPPDAESPDPLPPEVQVAPQPDAADAGAAAGDPAPAALASGESVAAAVAPASVADRQSIAQKRRKAKAKRRHLRRDRRHHRQGGVRR